MYLNQNKLLCASLIVAMASSVQANRIETDPIGLLELDVPAQSDALISLPLHRSPAFSGEIASIEGNTIHLSEAMQTLSWAADEWAYDEVAQPQTYYALLTSGELEGCFYTVTGNDANTLELDVESGALDLYDLSGDYLQLIPYWTLDTFFQGQAGLTASSGITGLGERSEVLFYQNGEGVNPAAAAVFYYYEGSGFGGSGWRLKGGGFSEIHNDQVIAPDRAFIFRNITDEAVSLQLPGQVQLTRSAIVLDGAESAQDLILASSNAVAVTLGESKLLETGGFQSTSSISGLNGDTLLVVDNELTGFNKPAASAYYYYSGASFGGPGWRRKGASFLEIMDGEKVLRAGQGVIIRKAAVSGGSENLWHFVPSYLSQDAE